MFVVLAGGIPSAAADDPDTAAPPTSPTVTTSTAVSTTEPAPEPTEPGPVPPSEPPAGPTPEPSQPPDSTAPEPDPSTDTVTAPTETSDEASEAEQPAEAKQPTESTSAEPTLERALKADTVDLAASVYGPEAAEPGEPVQWQVTVRNNGPDDAGSFTVTTAIQGGVTAVTAPAGCTTAATTVTCSDGPLAAGGQLTLTVSAVAPDPFTFPLITTVTVVPGSGDTDTDTGNNSDLTVTTTAAPAPSFGVVTRATLQDGNGNGVGDIGETITYTVDVNNTGNVSLFNLAVEHNGVTIPCGVTTLPLHGSTTCAAPSHVVTAGDLAAGEVVTITTGTAEAPSGAVVEAPESRTNVPAFVPNPLLALVKNADLDDDNGNSLADLGESIDFTFTVTNVGNVPLTGLSVVDPLLTGVSCPQTSLAPNAVVVCVSDDPHVTDAQDVADAQVVNAAYAEADAAGGASVQSPISVTNTPTVVSGPGLALDKMAVLDDTNGNGLADLGESLRWTFLVVNNGGVRLVGVHVDDPVAGPVTCASTTLELQRVTTCASALSHTVTEADIVAGEIRNTAVALGTTDPGGAPVESPPDTTVTPTAPIDPGLTLDKAADLDDTNENELADLGETIDYSFTLTNTGNVTLTDIEVDDPKAGEVTCPVTILVPGATVVCTAEPYTVTQEDIDAGVVRNVAVGTGMPPVGPPVVTPPDSAEVPVADPGLTLTKAAVLNDLDDDELADVDETIDYTFTLTNTGNVPLTDVLVDDPKAGVVTCPVTILAPGATVVCTAVPYIVTEDDLDAGVVRNVATGSGQPPGTDPPIVTPPATTEVPVDDGESSGGGATETGPDITLVKHAALSDEDGDALADVDEVVIYTFLVTNTGGEVLVDIVVDDPKIDGVTCPATTLAPGQSMTCTAPAYVVTEEDVDSGSVYNVATASGVPADGGDEVVSPPSSTGLPVDDDAMIGGGAAEAGDSQGSDSQAGDSQGGDSQAGDSQADGGLAYTGARWLGMLFGWALILLTGGVMLLAANRQRRRTQLK